MAGPTTDQERDLAPPSVRGSVARRLTRGALIAFVGILLIGTGMLGAASSEWYRHRDFYALYSGARLVAAGTDPFDETRWCEETEGVAPEAIDARGRLVCPTRYAYPLWTAVALLPLGVLPLPLAASIWLALSIAAMLLALRWAWLACDGRSSAFPLFVALVVGSQPFWLVVAGGQISGVVLLGVALATFWAVRGHAAAAGAALMLWSVKPNVAGLAALALAVRAAIGRDRAYLVGALTALVAAYALTIPAGPAWPVEWLRELFGRQIGYAGDYATAWGIAAHDVGTLAIAPILILVVAGATVALAGAVPRDVLGFTALAVPLSLFATPYAWSYDFVVLAVPWAYVLTRADTLSTARRRALTLALVLVASPLAWILYGLAFARETETLSAVVPALSALLVGIAYRLGERP